MANQISVKSNDSAAQWVQKANELNARAQETNQRIGELLKKLDMGAAGEIVVKLVQLGTQILQYAQQVFEKVKFIADTIRNVVDTLTSTVGSLVSRVIGIVGGA